MYYVLALFRRCWVAPRPTVGTTYSDWSCHICPSWKRR